jgi:hypothetical protein
MDRKISTSFLSKVLLGSVAASVYVFYTSSLPLPQNVAAHTLSPSITTSVIRNISVGQEISSNYGIDWFAYRNISIQDFQESVAPKTLPELEKDGICMSWTYVAASKILHAHNGVFVNRGFKADQLIEVSPVLVHEKSMVNKTGNVLINYLITSYNSNVTLLPISRVASINHGGKLSNVEIQWFFFDDDESALKKSPEELYFSPAAELFLAYKAKFDIDKDEELTIDYGERWDDLWNKHQASVHFKTTSFRESIVAPKDLFPPAWSDI